MKADRKSRVLAPLAAAVLLLSCLIWAAPGAEAAVSKVTAAKVTRVVDGDTFYARLSSGREEKVRLIGVDAPESTKEVEPYGKEAAAYAKKRLAGKTVYLELDVQQRDKYGRLLAYVWFGSPGPSRVRKPKCGPRCSTLSYS